MAVADPPADLMRSAMLHGADLIAFYDTYANCIWANAAHEKILGFTPEEMIGTRAHSIFPLDRQEEVEALHAQALAAAKQGMRVQIESPHKDGHTVKVDAMVTHCPGGESGRGFFFVVSRPTH